MDKLEKVFNEGKEMLPTQVNIALYTLYKLMEIASIHPEQYKSLLKGYEFENVNITVYKDLFKEDMKRLMNIQAEEWERDSTPFYEL